MLRVSFKSLNLFLLIISNTLISQTFDIEQTAQLMRPRLKFESKYTFDARFADTSGVYNSLENSVGVTFPIKRTFKTEISLNLSSLNLKDIFKNSVRIRSNEILGTFKVTQRQNTLGFDSIQKKNLYYANAGIIGLHLTKKYRIFFYTANVSIHEQDKTLSELIPRVSGVIGQYHIRGLRKGFYYGASLIYSDGFFIPSPFIGGTEPINSNLSFNYTLPVQINLQYRKDKSYTIVGTKIDGYRSGMLLRSERTNMNVTNASVFVNFRYRFSNTLQAQIEGGYNFYQNIRFTKTDNYIYNYPLKGAPYVNASINVLFGKSMLEKIVEQVF
jgi:hypothetical protein